MKSRGESKISVEDQKRRARELAARPGLARGKNAGGKLHESIRVLSGRVSRVLDKAAYNEGSDRYRLLLRSSLSLRNRTKAFVVRVASRGATATFHGVITRTVFTNFSLSLLLVSPVDRNKEKKGKNVGKRIALKLFAFPRRSSSF